MPKQAENAGRQLISIMPTQQGWYELYFCRTGRAPLTAQASFRCQRLLGWGLRSSGEIDGLVFDFVQCGLVPVNEAEVSDAGEDSWIPLAIFYDPELCLRTAARTWVEDAEWKRYSWKYTQMYPVVALA